MRVDDGTSRRYKGAKESRRRALELLTAPTPAISQSLASVCVERGRYIIIAGHTVVSLPECNGLSLPLSLENNYTGLLNNGVYIICMGQRL